ncbi:hypothetical protein TNCV_143221 [Trichonephila clavipes]|nr:hypothetical protein TNCV_143221 [Trichonephila clavipes]
MCRRECQPLGRRNENDCILGVGATSQFIAPYDFRYMATRKLQSRQTFILEESVVIGKKTEVAGSRFVFLPIRSCRERDRAPPKRFKGRDEKMSYV